MLLQIILSVLPFISFFAAYRIRKTTRYSIIYSILAVFMFTVAIGFHSIAMDSYLKTFHPLYNPSYYMFLLTLFSPFPPIQLFFIIKWSIEWNKYVIFIHSMKKFTNKDF